MQPNTMYHAHRVEATGKIRQKALVTVSPAESATALPTMADA